MENTLALSALQKLHAELGGKIKDNRREARQLVEQMKQVEAVLKMLDPGFDTSSIAAKRRYQQPNPYKRGQVFRNVLAVLRTAEHPLTSRELAVILLQKAGIAEPTSLQIRDMVGAVHPSLKNRVGKTIEAVGEGMPG